MEKSDFMKYLGAVRDIEGIVYVHEQTIKNLKQEYSTVSSRVKNNNYEKLYSHSGSGDIPPLSISECTTKGVVVGLTCGFFLCIGAVILGPIIATIFNGFSVSVESVVSTTVGLVVIALIIAIIIGFVSGKNMYDKYRYGSPQWRSVENNNNKIKESNKKWKEKDSIKMKFIPQEIKMLENNLYESRKLLNDYYAVNILHKDYRNLVAVCSIYQYFDSGRCSELKGAHGAYNLYEEEKFKRIVISKLDEIISKLNQIRQTQSELYQVMCRCQQEINSLRVATDNMNETLTSIQQSSKIIEYNSTYMRQNEEYRVLLRGY